VPLEKVVTEADERSSDEFDSTEFEEFEDILDGKLEDRLIMDTLDITE